eukprot:1066818_1
MPFAIFLRPYGHFLRSAKLIEHFWAEGARVEVITNCRNGVPNDHFQQKVPKSDVRQTPEAAHQPVRPLQLGGRANGTGVMGGNGVSFLRGGRACCWGGLTVSGVLCW